MKFFSENSTNVGMKTSQMTIKKDNIKRVFNIINSQENVSRAQIAKKIGLTPTTVSSLVDELIDIGFVIETGEGESRPTGRKPIILAINSKGLQIPVISFKQSGILYTLYNLKLEQIENVFATFPKELQVKKVNGQESIKYRDINGLVFSDIIIKLLKNDAKKLNRDKVRAMCITMPGTFEWDKNIFSSSVLQVRGSTEFIKDIRNRIEHIPILVGNESVFLAYAESKNINEKDLLFVNISEGVGAGIIQNGKIFGGAYDLSGEIGHISIDINGRECFCGNHGCVERYINQNAIIGEVIKAIRSGKSSAVIQMVENDTGKIDWNTLCRAYYEGDELVSGIVNNSIKYLVLGLSNMICAINTRQIILGGGIEKLGDKFIQEIRNQAKIIGFRKGMSKVNIQYATIQKNGECLGVAKHYIDKFFSIIGNY